MSNHPGNIGHKEEKRPHMSKPPTKTANEAANEAPTKRQQKTANEKPPTKTASTALTAIKKHKKNGINSMNNHRI